MARLSEAELVALRDFAGTFMLERAAERLRKLPEHPERNPDPEQSRRDEHQWMIASSEVYGALRNVELEFSDLGTDRETPEGVDVEFTEAAMGWLEELRGEVRRGLDAGRGTIEVNENTPDETFLLFVLDGICGGAS